MPLAPYFLLSRFSEIPGRPGSYFFYYKQRSHGIALPSYRQTRQLLYAIDRASSLGATDTLN